MPFPTCKNSNAIMRPVLPSASVDNRKGMYSCPATFVPCGNVKDSLHGLLSAPAEPRFSSPALALRVRVARFQSVRLAVRSADAVLFFAVMAE
jgi:hypothetical protein